jgi:holliday junction DNA helicase RuvA
MIASLRGKLQHKGLDRVIVEVGGVGYLVLVSMQTLAGLPPVGESVQLLCHTHVREDALQIFGFLEEKEQKAFELLILVSGIGPRLALVALAGMPAGELLEVIAQSDHRRLQTIPGIGKKTAERMVVELKDRCAKLVKELGPSTPHGLAPIEEVVEALANLGYKRAVAEKAVVKVAEGAEAQTSLEELLRRALAVIREI